MLQKNKKLYYVGGVVRDEILNKPSLDTDLCYEGNAIEFSKQQGLKIIKENPAFGTVRIKIDGKEVDIASTRTESYPKKGHLPVVENIGCPLKDDLKRRDFTINAMAKRTSDNEVIDYFNGINDIENKTINVLHDKSFVDDPTRIIRALKFSVRFNFNLSEKTKDLQNKYLNNINYDMSYHRLKKELTEAFSINSPDLYNRFINEKIYKLLGEDIQLPNISGDELKKAANTCNLNNKWFIYIAPILSLNEKIYIPLTRSEKRIIEWTKKLNNQAPNNNTPPESIIIRRLMDNI